MRKLYLLFFFLIIPFTWANSQIQDPVKWKTELKNISESEAEIVFTAKIDNGWHVYSVNLPEGGPVSATFTADKYRC